MSSQILTPSDNVRVRAGGSGRAIDYNQDGTLWIALSDTSTDLKFYYSKDDGQSWTHSSGSNIVNNTTGPVRVTLFIDKDDHAHCAYDSGGTNELEYRHGIPNEARTGWTWSNAIGLNLPSSTGGGATGMDVVAHREGTVWVAHAVFTDVIAAGSSIAHAIIDIDSGHLPTLRSITDIRNLGASVAPMISIDFRHTQDDPKLVQSSIPSIYACWNGGAGAPTVDLEYMKITYSGGSWTPGTVRSLAVGTSAVEGGTPSLFYDGTRVFIAYVLNTTLTVVSGFERDEADTTTTAQNPTALADGNVLQLSGAYGKDADIWLLAKGETSLDYKKIRYNRVGGTWGSWSVVEADTSDPGQATQTIARGVELARVPFLPAAYTLRGSTPDEHKFSTIVAYWTAEATLRGVATMVPSPTLAMLGEVTLQGVATIAPGTGVQAFAANANLQGVATLGGQGLFIPRLDFTVFDGYIVDPFDSAYIPVIYHDTEQTPKRTGAVRLRPPRQDTGLGPTEVRPESGEIFSQQDFSHGAGQLYFHHEGRDARKYLWSEGFDLDIDTIGEPAILHHLHNVPVSPVTSILIGQIEVFNDLPFVIDGTKVKRGDGNFPGVWTDEDPSGVEADVTVKRIVSSGEFLYAALGAGGIHRRDTAGVWTHWSNVLATQVAWVKNRIMASDGTKLYEVVTSGVAPSALETLPAGWTFERIFEAGGFIYAVAISSTSGLSRIHTYGENSAGTGLEKKNETPFPRDQLIRSGRGYLGAVYIGGGIKTSTGGYDPVVYQAFPQDDGSLTYAKVAEGEGAGAQDLSVLEFEPIGEDVLFGWSLGSGAAFGARDGLAIHKLAVGAFLPHLKKNGAGAGRQVVGLAFYKGRILFSLKGDGFYYEDITKFVQEAELISSVADWQTTAKKTWDLIQVSHAPLPASTVVRVDTTTKLPSVAVWTQQLVSSVEGEEVVEVRVPELEGRTLAIRLRSTSNSGQTLAPEGVGFFVRSNLLPDNPEFGLGRVLRVLDEDQKDEHAETVYQDVEATRRRLHFLAHRWVTLHEPGVTWSCRVEDVQEIEPTGPTFQETEGESEKQGYLIQLSLAGTRD